MKDHQTLAKWLKAAVIALALIGAVVYAVIIPSMGVTMRAQYPEFSDRFWPWLLFLTSTAIPCYTILVFGWLIARSIGQGRSFSMENAARLKKIAVTAGVLSLYFFVGNNALWLLNMSHPGIVIGSLLFVLAGFAVTVAAAALSRLVARAADLQDESDLTI